MARTLLHDPAIVTESDAASPWEGFVLPVAKEIKRRNIIWHFDKEYVVGRYVNGDWWVLGPVVITRVNPAPFGTGAGLRHGSMVNPMLGTNGDDQAYDGRVYGFNSSLVVNFPLTLNPGESLVSTRSILTFPYDPNTPPDPFPTTYRTQKTSVAGYTQTALVDGVVLTCVSSVPAADAFRPAFVGTTKTQFTASQLQTNLLPSLSKPAGTNEMNLQELARLVKYTWMDTKREWMRNEIAPINNQVSYGRDKTVALGDVGIALCRDFTLAQKLPLLYGLVQIGIDYYAASQLNADLWHTSGGYSTGNKFPILFAAKLLNQSWDVSDVAFQEDQATYLGADVSPAQTLWTGWQNSGHAYASNAMYLFEETDDTLGNPWYHEGIDALTGWRGVPFPNNGNQYPESKHEAYRRLVTYALQGQTIVTRLMGLKSTWAHDAYFDYVDRWVYEDDIVPFDAMVAALTHDDTYPGFSVYNPRGQSSLSRYAKQFYLEHRAGN